MAPSSDDKVFSFEKDENVLCYHGPLIYEAQIMDRVAREGPECSKIKLYFVHYHGWNTHWDEWVPESRVLKHTAEHLQQQKNAMKEFQRAHKRKRVEKTEGGVTPSSSGIGGLQAKKAKKAGDEETAGLVSEIKEQLRLPQSMKLKLIEDWERITREKKLVPLPRRETSIANLLDHFLQAKAKRTSHERLYGEVSDGVKTFFNQAIGTLLLYKYERKQFRELKETHRDSSYAELYGVEHLLRLFVKRPVETVVLVKLPELLAHCKMQHERRRAHLTVLLAKLLELLKFVQANKAQYFAEQYEPASEEYLQWWSSE